MGWDTIWKGYKLATKEKRGTGFIYRPLTDLANPNTIYRLGKKTEALDLTGPFTLFEECFDAIRYWDMMLKYNAYMLRNTDIVLMEIEYKSSPYELVWRPWREEEKWRKWREVGGRKQIYTEMKDLPRNTKLAREVTVKHIMTDEEVGKWKSLLERRNRNDTIKTE